MIIVIFNLITLLFFLSAIYGYIVQKERLQKKIKEYENGMLNNKLEKELIQILKNKDYIDLIDYVKEIDDVKTKNDMIIYLVFNYLSANDTIKDEFCGIDDECYKEFEKENKKVMEKAHTVLRECENKEKK